MHVPFEVVIVGGGLAGLTLALALAQGEIAVAVVERADPATMLAAGFDGRVSAIASASRNMLDALGFAQRIVAEGCPIRAIRVSDGCGEGQLRFETAPDEPPLGTMVENRALRRWLHDAVIAHPLIHLFAPIGVARTERDDVGARVHLADGRTLTAQLVVAADGRESPLRAEAAIRVARWRYDQVALVTNLAHERPHDHIASELFYPAGPFALLPMLDDEAGRHRSALVWTVDARDAPGTLKLGPRALEAEIAKRAGDLLGRAERITPVSHYPLGLHHAERYHARRLILCGDSAHGIHPIAGQGLNMGLRDVAALAQVLVEGARLGMDLGAPELARRYESWRRFDNSSVAFATDALNRLFAIPGRPAAAARRLGLGAVERIAPLKRFFMQTARGETGELPRLLRGVGI